MSLVPFSLLYSLFTPRPARKRWDPETTDSFLTATLLTFWRELTAMPSKAPEAFKFLLAYIVAVNGIGTVLIVNVSFFSFETG